jgi:hypothetical protein
MMETIPKQKKTKYIWIVLMNLHFPITRTTLTENRPQWNTINIHAISLQKLNLDIRLLKIIFSIKYNFSAFAI